MRCDFEETKITQKTVSMRMINTVLRKFCCVVLLVVQISHLSAQNCDCPYPIIFVHGWKGTESSWKVVSEEIAPIWDNYEIQQNFNSNNTSIGNVIYSHLNSVTPLGSLVDDVVFHDQLEFYSTYYGAVLAPVDVSVIPGKCIYAISFDTKEVVENQYTTENFDLFGGNQNDINDSDSNQSAVFKQGYALGKSIEKVLALTGKDKVILVGHSMGGLAIREYLQRPHWSGSHHVAKVLTVGTPHLGSNTGNHTGEGLAYIVSSLLGFDLRSEAVRDLRYSYGSNSTSTPGVYLFGGAEGDIPLGYNGSENYYNSDVNCNGSNSDTDLEGINSESADSNNLPLPLDIKYTYYVSDIIPGAPMPNHSDGIVLANRQWLYEFGDGSTADYSNNISIPSPIGNNGAVILHHFNSDRISVDNAYHVSKLVPFDVIDVNTYETGDKDDVIRGLDEPDFPYFAYEIDMNQTYAGMIQRRASIVADNSNADFGGFYSDNDPFIDSDWYHITLSETPANGNSCELEITLNSVEGKVYQLDFFNENISLYDNPVAGAIDDSGSFLSKSGIATEDAIKLTVPFNVITGTGFYIRVTHALEGGPILSPDKWYSYKINSKFKSNCYENECAIVNNCLNYDATCNGDGTYDVEVYFGTEGTIPDGGFTIFSYNTENGSEFQTIENATPNVSTELNTITNVPLEMELQVLVRETELDYCPGDQEIINYFPDFEPEIINATCIQSNSFILSYTLDEGGALDEYLISDNFGNSEILTNSNSSFSQSYQSGASVILTLSDPDGLCSQSVELFYDCNNPPANLCENVSITSHGVPDCNNNSIEIGISGDPSTTYIVREIYNDNPGVPAYISGGTSGLVSFNLDGSGLVSFAIQYPGQPEGEYCDSEIGIDVSSCTTTNCNNNGVVDSGETCQNCPGDVGPCTNEDYCLYWPFSDGSVTNSNPWHVVEGSPFHTGGDLYAQDWNLLSGGNSDCGEPLYAPLDGVVWFAGPTSSSYGNQVIIQAADYVGVAHRSAHLQTINVSTGDVVTAGQLIGTIGNTGDSSFTCHHHGALHHNLDDSAWAILQGGGGLGSTTYAAEFEYSCQDQLTVLSGSSEGQCFAPGEPYTITFSEAGTLQNVVIEFCENSSCEVADGGNVFDLNNSLSQDTWTLNTTTPVSEGNYSIKIYDPINTAVLDISSFTIEVSSNCGEVTSTCIAPINFTAVSSSDGETVDVSWTPVAGATGYNIEAKLSTSSSWTRSVNNVQVTNFTTNSDPCIGYDLRVAAICEDGTTTNWNQISFVTEGCDGPNGSNNGSATGAGIVGDCPGDNDDDEDPVFFNCPPQNYVFGIDNSDECMAYVNWSVPVALDNCNVTITQISGPEPGTLVGPGEYTVIYLAEDNNGNSETCDFTVVVEDSQILEFVNCPETIVFGNDSDQCSVTANWSVPVATDNCEVTVSHVSGPQPGDELEPGIYNVIYRATNNATPPESEICSFFVHVLETQNPELNCPQDVWESNDQGVCEAVVENIQLEFAFDNCPYQVTWSSAPTDVTGTGSSTTDNASGAIFPVGVTTVTYTITELDDNGNGLASAECELIVTVTDEEAPIITCPENAFIGTSMESKEDCQADYTWTHPIPTDNCAVTVYNITYHEPNGNVDGPIDILGQGGTTITRVFLTGITTVTYHVEDAEGNITECSFTVEVEDDENPRIFCEEVVATNTYHFEGSLDIRPNDLTTAIIHVEPSMEIVDVNITRLAGTHPDMGDLTVTLTSPEGTSIVLFSGLCSGNEDYDVQLDDEGMDAISSAPCGPLGGGMLFSPQESLSAFNGENSIGDWTLSFTNDFTGICGILNQWDLEIIGNNVTSDGNRLQVVADESTCTYMMSEKDFDPRFTDNCPDPYIRHDLITGPFDHTLQGAVFPIGETEVTWTVYDRAGNTEECTLIIEVLDTEAPEFTNCPMPDIIQNAETGECGAYVTFSQPLAVDNCGDVTVSQIDGTGLNSGSVFPVGMTVMTWEAEDAAGNTRQCSLRVIVNDTQQPELGCPENVLENMDPWKCSAIVNNISAETGDQCPQNVAVTYQIEYPSDSGEVFAGGVVDASGEEFYGGVSKVHYKLSDQPLLLITEITHEIDITNGGMYDDDNPIPYDILTTDDYLEITNIGPASMNVGGLKVERLGSNLPEVFTIPDNTIVGVGETIVIHFGNGTDEPDNLFFNLPCAVDMSTGTGAAYVMSFKDRVLDMVAVNGYAPIGAGTVVTVTNDDWTGSIETMVGKGGVKRLYSYDNNDAKDWVVADVCNPIDIGEVNSTIDIIPDNGTMSALQSIMPNMLTCNFTVEVVDQELPYCGEFIEHVYGDATRLNEDNSIIGGSVFKSVITVNDDFEVGDVNILDILGMHPEMSDLTFKLRSPEGTQVVLFEGLCTGSADFDLNLASDTFPSVNTAICSPLGGGETFAPINSLCAVNYAFYGESSQGDWTLEIADSVALNSGLLENWNLRLWEISQYSQTDTIIGNEPGLCGAEFTWIHPRLIDNCKQGTVLLKFVSEDEIDVPESPGVIVQADTITEYFIVGTTTVRYILQDGAGNIDSCEFNVTIEDREMPHIVCPEDISIYLKGGECREWICVAPALAEDNCEVVDTFYSVERCGFFEIGTTPVDIIIYDDAGNIDSCQFNVNVYEYDPSTNSLTCNDRVNISLGVDCEHEVTADDVLEGENYHCYEDYLIVLIDEKGDTIPTSPIITKEYEGQVITYTVIDSDSDVACWGEIKVEEKLIPIIECPADTSILCTADRNMRDENGKLLTGELILKSCEDNTTYIYEDEIINHDKCDDPVSSIERTFYLTDDDGHTVSCTQQIDVIPFDFEQIVWPEDVTLQCSAYDGEQENTLPEQTGFPRVGGVIVDNINSLCNVSHSYTDQQYWICGNSYEILRTWSIRNRCLEVTEDNPISYTQVIEVIDDVPPKIYPCPEDIEVSVDPWSCSGSTELPIPSKLEDICSDINFEVYVYGSGFLDRTGSLDYGNLTLNVENINKGGNTTVRYVLRDECGNSATCDFKIFVIDRTPPVVTAKKDIVVSLANNGSAKLYAEKVDNGSYDSCTDVGLEIRRSDGSPCGVSADNSYVEFCCSDLEEIQVDANQDGVIDALDKGYIEVILKVWDDADGNGVYGSSGDNYNESWAIVKVEDKLPPVLNCPADITILCDDEIDISTDFGSGYQDASQANFDLTGTASGDGACGPVAVQFRDNAQLNQCGEGLIRRKWRASIATANGIQEVTCDQQIIVEGKESEFLVTGPSQTTRTWSSCTFDPADIPDSHKPTVKGGSCDVVGENIKVDTFLFEDGVCKKWAVTYNYVNWCDGEEAGPYSVYYFYDDESKPELTHCNNEMIPVDGDCKTMLVASNIAVDDGGCTEGGWLKWQLFVDTWADGLVEYYGSSYISGTQWKPVPKFIGTQLNPEWTQLPVGNQYADLVYVKGIGSSVSEQLMEVEIEEVLGSMSNHKVKWVVSDGCHNDNTCEYEIMLLDKKAPTPYCVDISTALMGGPNNMVELWAVDFNQGSYDNCTNVENLMYSFYGTEPRLKDTLIRSGNKDYKVNKLVPHYFDENNTFIDFDSDGITPWSDGIVYPKTKNSTLNSYGQGINQNGSGVQKWQPLVHSSGAIFRQSGPWQLNVSVWDEKCNTEFCTVLLTINESSNNGGAISGRIITKNGAGVENVKAILSAPLGEYPVLDITDEFGYYAINNNPLSQDFSLRPEKKEVFRNGLTTIDLVMIQRHILGQVEFNNPYDIIAADVDGNGLINPLDLLVLRKLILNIVNEVPGVTSWKFIDATQTWNNPQRPWPIRESRNVMNLQGDVSGVNFIAVKIGDCNGSAELRSNSPLNYVIEDREVFKGQEISVKLYSEEDIRLYGTQFTLETGGMTFAGITSSTMEVNESNIGNLSSNTITFSGTSPLGRLVKKGDELLELKFNVNKSGKLSDMFKVTSRYTKAEVYVSELLVTRPVKLVYKNNQENIPLAFKLYQNEPNPFKESTKIRFDSPNEGKAKITVLTSTGQVLLNRTIDMVQGYNELVLKQSDIPLTGILYYQVETNENRALKKMVCIK